MDAPQSRTISVAAATLAVCVLLGVLGWFLQQQGYSTSRLVFFAILGGAGVLSLAGIVLERTAIAAAGIGVLVVLGFWQAVLWIVVYPVIAVLVLATLGGIAEPATEGTDAE